MKTVIAGILLMCVVLGFLYLKMEEPVNNHSAARPTPQKQQNSGMSNALKGL